MDASCGCWPLTDRHESYFHMFKGRSGSVSVFEKYLTAIKVPDDPSMSVGILRLTRMLTEL